MFKTNYILKGISFLSCEALSLGTKLLSHTIYWVIPIILLLSISRGDSNSYNDYEFYTITWVLSTSPKSMHIVVLNGETVWLLLAFHCWKSNRIMLWLVLKYLIVGNVLLFPLSVRWTLVSC